MTRSPLALLAMAADLPDLLFDEQTRRRMAEVYDVDFEAVVRDFAEVPDEVMARVDVLLTGWESPRIDDAALDRAPRLRGIMPAAGSVKSTSHPSAGTEGSRCPRPLTPTPFRLPSMPSP